MGIGVSQFNHVCLQLLSQCLVTADTSVLSFREDSGLAAGGEGTVRCPLVERYDNCQRIPAPEAWDSVQVQCIGVLQGQVCGAP